MSKINLSEISYRPVFRDLDAQQSKQIEMVFAVIHQYGLNVHTWFVEYSKACDANGGVPPSNFEKFMPWNMTKEERKRLKKAVPVDYTDKSCIAQLWLDNQ